MGLWSKLYLVPLSWFGKVFCKHVMKTRESMSRVPGSLSINDFQPNQQSSLYCITSLWSKWCFPFSMPCRSVCALCLSDNTLCLGFFKCWIWCLSVLPDECSLLWNEGGVLFNCRLVFYLCDISPDANCFLDAACVFESFIEDFCICLLSPLSCPLQKQKQKVFTTCEWNRLWTTIC